jgi:hypothetical protein
MQNILKYSIITFVTHMQFEDQLLIIINYHVFFPQQV